MDIDFKTLQKAIKGKFVADSVPSPAEEERVIMAMLRITQAAQIIIDLYRHPLHEGRKQQRNYAYENLCHIVVDSIKATHYLRKDFAELIEHLLNAYDGEGNYCPSHYYRTKKPIGWKVEEEGNGGEGDEGEGQ